MVRRFVKIFMIKNDLKVKYADNVRNYYGLTPEFCSQNIINTSLKNYF